MIVHIENAFLLRKQDFRNTSLIASFLTNNGKIKGVIKGAKQPKKGGERIDYLSEFSFVYRKKETETDLKNLYSFESINFYQFSADFIYKYFFLNEIIDKFLLENMSSEKLFLSYKKFLITKTEETYLEVCFSLFDTLGFAINFESDIDGKKFCDNEKYDFDGYTFIKSNYGQFLGSDIIVNEKMLVDKVIKLFINYHLKSNYKSEPFLTFSQHK